MTVLMAAAECRGVAKVGGLADVVFDLSHRLAAEGTEVFVVLPLYAELAGSVVPAPLPVLDFLVRFEGASVPARLLSAVVDGLRVHLVEAPLFQGDSGSVYVDSGRRGKGPFEDDARRFAFFSAAVWTLVKHGQPFGRVDLVHCHDWHTGLLPLLARLDAPELRPATLFTIHNLDYQGTRPFDEPYAPGASWRQWFPERWDAFRSSPFFALSADPGTPDCFNPIRCGIRLADGVSTVSPTYAAEITRPDDAAANFLGGRGLEADLQERQREGRLAGILNGLDYVTFDPARLAPPFDAASPRLEALRAQHRRRLLDGLGSRVESLAQRHGARFANVERVRAHLPVFLAAAAGMPLTVCVTRAVSQKLGLFTEDHPDGGSVSDAVLAEGTALLVVGTGELSPRLEVLNERPAALFLEVFDAAIATELYAAGDLFLMPSDFEPCGISQLMALRYGCLPLVHDRGGLHDTVADGLTGFVYGGATRDQAKRAFVATVRRALATLATRGAAVKLRRRAMEQRFSWEGPVAAYRDFYTRLRG